MKFVALVSGGKDSCYNIIECTRNGHELVALANLYPQGAHELDSFMYQTVGFNVLEKYEECIGVPMFREPILGHSSVVSMQYEAQADDETEDLYRLLQRVLKTVPEIEAVSVGAILSNYQRIRVEHVCQRLGLQCLSFLWHRDQSHLMAEMCESGMDARILKVGAVGLNASHLGMSLREIFPKLVELHEMYDVHVCGEGGEFETIVLDAPFFQKRLQIVGSETVCHSKSDDVYYLKLETEVCAKDEAEPARRVFHPLFGGFEGLLAEVAETAEIAAPAAPEVAEVAETACVLPSSSVRREGHLLYLRNFRAPDSGVAAQTKAVFKAIFAHCTPQSVLSVNLTVRTMRDFADINAVYAQQFPGHLPPARTCIEAALPSGCHLVVSAVAESAESAETPREGLHVQSRSLWAPANIGPYSQARLDRTAEMAYLAGQIPLVPASMSFLSPQTPAADTVLALKHAVAVRDAIGHPEFCAMVCYVAGDDQIFQMAIKAFGSIADKRRLLLARVARLPRSASVEWSGLSYRPVESDVDSLDENYTDPFAKVGAWGSRGSLVANKGTLAGMVWFTRDETVLLDSICAEFAVTVWASPADVSRLSGEFEYVPVEKVVNHSLDEVAYGALVRSH